MEEVYKKISAGINIDGKREPYTNVYDFVRGKFINDLKEIEVFKDLFCDLSLAGSYADNLKITAPDEFDLDIRLEFPFHSDVVIEEDNFGNIYINLEDVITKMEARQPQKEYMIKFLKSVVDGEGYLLQNKFHSWFESCVTKFYTKNRGKLIYQNEILLFSYYKSGPAHTLDIETKHAKLSIDFVPVIRFPCYKSIFEKIPQDGYWEAVPKPVFGRQSNKSFRCSFVDAERKLLKGKFQFKNTLRLMKKYRDMRPHLTNLKSYYIKTLFLWSNLEKEEGYWRNSNLTIMDEMFERLEKALETKTLPFYWDERLNLLSALSDGQVRNMYLEVKRTRQILLKHEDLDEILEIFLTKRNLNTMEPQAKIDIEKSFSEVVSYYVSAAADMAVEAVKEHPVIAVGVAAIAAISLWQIFRSSNQQNQ